MLLSVVILNYNTAFPLLKKNLDALQTMSLKDDFEIIFVHNWPKQNKETKQLKKLFPQPNIIWINTSNKGYPASNNLGLKKATGQYLCMQNPDIIVQKNSYQLLINYLEKNSQIGIIAPQLIYPNGDIQDSYRQFPNFLDLIIKRTFLKKFFPKRMAKYLMWKKDPSQIETVDWLVWAFFLLPRTVYQEIWPNNEKYFLFMSDVELCKKVWQKNYQVVYYPKVKVTHHESRLSGGGIKDFFVKKTVRIHVWDAIKYFLGR